MDNYEEHKLIEACIAGNSYYQKMLYKRFSAKMMGVCLRYSQSREEAEDILQEGFIKVFRSLKQYKNLGSFEGWIRKIMVNTALANYRKKTATGLSNDTENIDNYIYNEGVNGFTNNPFDTISQLNTKELLKLIQSLPRGYQLVFNMYVIEGYNHKEIGEMLGISEGTSKSQLSRARVLLQNEIKKLYGITDYHKTKKNMHN